MNPYRIVLADDHVMFRQGIRRIIEENGDLEVVGEVSDGVELMELLETKKPNMVILDISMPKLQVIEATPKIKKIHHEVKILILTIHKEFLYHTMSTGAEGYLLTKDTDSELFSAIETIRKGGIYISPILSAELSKDLVQSFRTNKFKRSLEYLTAREIEILKLIAEGKSSKEIADQLFISVRTVHHHRENIVRKLKIRKTAHLVKYAISKGFTSTIIEDSSE